MSTQPPTDSLSSMLIHGAIVGFLVGLCVAVLDLIVHCPAEAVSLQLVFYVLSLYGLVASLSVMISTFGLHAIFRMKKKFANNEISLSPRILVILVAIAVLVGLIVPTNFFQHRNNPALVEALNISARGVVAFSLFGLMLISICRLVQRNAPKSTRYIFLLFVTWIGLPLLLAFFSEYSSLQGSRVYASFKWLALKTGIAIVAMYALRNFTIKNFGKTLATSIAAASAIVTLYLGSAQAIQMKSFQYTRLSEFYSSGIRSLYDRDGDGFSPLLAGGDCNDKSANINPNMPDLPGDGIDQNCLNGDAQVPVTRASPSPSELPRYNVLLITVDAFRWDRLGGNGYKRSLTPNLDKLAQTSAVFDNAWSQGSSTRTSLWALQLGTLPILQNDQRTEALRLSSAMPNSITEDISPSSRTLSELFTAHDYNTIGIGIPWLVRKNSYHRGFERFVDFSERCKRSSCVSAQMQSQEAIRSLEKLDSRNFFMWIHYFGPHDPYVQQPNYPFGTDPVDRYDSEIANVDEQIGLLFDFMAKQKLTENTVIFVLSDHGESFGEDGMHFHSSSLSETQTRIPLIVHVPKLPQKRLHQPVGHTDIYATLAHYLSERPPRTGTSFLNLLTGNSDRTPRYVYQQLLQPTGEQRSLRTERCNVFFQLRPHRFFETTPIGGDQQPHCKKERQLLVELYETFELPVDAFNTVPRKPIPADINPLLSVNDTHLLKISQRQGNVGNDLGFLLTFHVGQKPIPHDLEVKIELIKGNEKYSHSHKPVRPVSWWKPGQEISYSIQFHEPKFIAPLDIRITLSGSGINSVSKTLRDFTFH